VQRELAGFPELRVADGQRPGDGVEVRSVQRERFADPHPRGDQQTEQRLKRRGLVGDPQRARRCDQCRDLLVGVEIGNRTA